MPCLFVGPFPFLSMRANECAYAHEGSYELVPVYMFLCMFVYVFVYLFAWPSVFVQMNFIYFFRRILRMKKI